MKSPSPKDILSSIRTENGKAIPIILIIGVLMLLPGTWHLPLLDRDEPRFAQATVEMMARQDWVIPTFNETYRFDKPVLTYWLMRAGYALFGINEMGARWHSVMATLMIALTLYATGRRWFSGRAGYWAALCFLTGFQIILNGRSCVADMPMILSVTIAQVALFELLHGAKDDKSVIWMFSFYVALGIGFLAKGPIALLVPVITLTLFRSVFWRRPLPWRRLRPHIGLPLMLIIIGAWGLPALLQTNGQFWEVGIYTHVVRRGLEVFHKRLYSPFFYLGTIFVSLFPWIAFADHGWQALGQKWDPRNAFLVSWFVSPYLIFSFYATQLPHYVMPGFPAFFLILARAFVTAPISDGKRWWRRLVIWGATIWSIVLVIGFIVALIQRAPSGVLLILSGVITMQMGFMLVLYTFKHTRRLPWLAVLLIASGPLLLGYGLRPLYPAARLIPIFKNMPVESEFMGFGFKEGSLVFYSNKKWSFSDDATELSDFLARPSARMAVMLETETKIDRIVIRTIEQLIGTGNRLKQDDRRSTLKALDLSGYQMRRLSGLNLGRFSWVNLVVAYKNG